MVLVLLGVLAIVVVLARLSGSPVRSTLGASPEATEERIKALEKEYGLDKPVYQQYFIYLGQVLHGNLGRSFPSERPTLDIFLERFPLTLKLAGVAIPFVVFGGMLLGTIAALGRGRTADIIIRVVATLFQAIPSFWLAIILILVFGVWLHWAPFGGDRGWTYVLLPAIAVAIYPIAGVIRMTRTAILNVMGEDYINVARAKGLRERTVVARHAMRNALLPITTYVSMVVVSQVLLGGLAVEVVFAWPGVGYRAYQAISERDYGVLQGFVLLFGVIYCCANLLVDLSYAYLDPRTRRA